MGWTTVGLVKNELNEYRFAVIPNVEQFYSGGNNNTIFRIGGMRGAGKFTEGEPYAKAINAQDGIFRMQEPNPTSTNEMVYGTVGGSALNLRIDVSRSNPFDRLDIIPYLYKNMAQYRQLNNIGTFLLIDTSRTSFVFWTWALLINHDTEECYLGCLHAGITWEYAIEQPASGDIAEVLCYVCDSGGKNGEQNLYSIFKDSIPGGAGSNPYADGGYSEPGGGENQNFDEVSDTIDLPSLPTYGATGTGFVTAFCPTVQEINDVADYLIQPNIAQVIQGLFAKMSDVIIGLHLLPFVVDASNSKNIELHALAFSIDTQVSSHYANNQYQRISMGSIDVLKCWDNCLDYNPYTFVSIYLPFCGYFELDTDEVMGKTLTVTYDVDIITGSCVALIQVDGSVMYQFSGMCSCQIPITSVDFNQAVQSLIGLGASAAAGIKMIKGAAAATEEAASVAMAPTTKNSVRQAAYENYMEAKMNEQEIKDSVASRLANASVNAVITGKGNYMHAGAVSSAPGFLACRKPFLIIKRPKQSVPEDYESMRGFPSNMKATLGDLSGYTEVEDIHLNIPDATVDEIVECERLLKGGVYL